MANLLLGIETRMKLKSNEPNAYKRLSISSDSIRMLYVFCIQFISISMEELSGEICIFALDAIQITIAQKLNRHTY